MEVMKICPVCGKQFRTPRGNHKYCSEACRKSAAKQTRKDWEERTGYRENQRVRRREQRHKEAADGHREAADGHRKNDGTETHEGGKKPTGGIDAALNRLMRASPFSIEYFESLKDYETCYASAWSREPTLTVNGIPVQDPEFALKASLSVQEMGVMMTECETPGNKKAPSEG